EFLIILGQLAAHRERRFATCRDVGMLAEPERFETVTLCPSPQFRWWNSYNASGWRRYQSLACSVLLAVVNSKSKRTGLMQSSRYCALILLVSHTDRANRRRHTSISYRFSDEDPRTAGRPADG